MKPGTCQSGIEVVDDRLPAPALSDVFDDNGVFALVGPCSLGGWSRGPRASNRHGGWGMRQATVRHAIEVWNRSRR